VETKKPNILLRWLEAHEAEMLRWIRRAVEIESPSYDKASVDAMGRFLTHELARIGGRVKIHKRKAYGDLVQADFAAPHAKQRPVLLLGHHDTVWELGTLKKMPWHVRDGRIWGPGTLDMKAGLAQVLFALRALQHNGGLPRPVIVLSVCDEEIGSHASREVTESLAKRCAAVLVLEPAQGLKGAVKTARKGVGDYFLRVTGKAAHAGVDFASGASAIVELARQIQAIAGLTGLRPGLTVNPGMVRGGTRTNVIAAEAEVGIDIRVARNADAAFIDRRLRRLRPFNRQCKLEIHGTLNRPPMERKAAIARLFSQARTLARTLDKSWKLEEASTGGGSDGNFTAALGIPTLDGLGAVGEGAHAAHESALIREIPRRAALLAALIAGV